MKDPGKVHLVFEFSTPEQAEHAVEELARNGFETTLAGSAEDVPTAVAMILADSEHMRRTQRRARAIAGDLGGRYQGKAHFEPEPERPAPKMVKLDQPRQLSEDERTYLDFMLTHPGSVAELDTQAQSVQVVSECDCGCRSIGLEPAASAPPAEAGPESETFGRDDYFLLEAEGESLEGNRVELFLHVVEGRMVELEIWDGAERTSGMSRGETPEFETLEHR